MQVTELAIEAEFLTHVGRKRRHNEDFVDCFEPADPEELAHSGRLYIVADGVGGAADGEVASEYAVKKVLHEYYRSTEPDLGERLKAVIRAANADIFEHVQRRPELGRMGTTVVAAAVRDDELVVANVGDSRAYLIRNGEIHQITRDHSLVAKLVDEGSITPEEAERHPRRNVLLRSIGADPDTYPDTFEGRLQPGDQVVLCSDGLTRYVSDDEILDVATHTRADRAVKRFVETANARGGKDNISVMLIRATEAMPPPALAETVGGLRTPLQPEFDAIHDTVSRRRKTPSRLPIPKWALAFGGAFVGVCLLLGALFIGGRALGIIPFFAEPTDIPTLTVTFTTPSTVILPTPVPPTVTPTPTPPQDSSPVVAPLRDLRYVAVPGDTLWYIEQRWGIRTGCISETNTIEDPDALSPGDALTIPVDCLTGEGLTGQIIFTNGPETGSPVTYVLDIMSGTTTLATAEQISHWTPAPRELPRPAPLPNDDRVARVQAKDGTSPLRFGNLWIRSSTGEQQRYQLTSGSCAADPVWAPNGRYIAFTSVCTVEISGEESVWSHVDRPSDIWVVPARKISDEPQDASYIVLVAEPPSKEILAWQDRRDQP
jgi:serine/threonine protein phosphatase PrpC